MLSDFEVNAVLDALTFKRRHTLKCRTEHGIERWDTLKGKRCACPFYSCGVHAAAEGFQRKYTGQIVEAKARETVAYRLRTGNAVATLDAEGATVKAAIEDFMGTLETKQLSEATVAKYQTLMDQLQAFCDFSGYKTIASFDQDAMALFFKSWSDSNAGYKLQHNSKLTHGQRCTKWRTQSSRTAKKNLKTMSLFFRRCMKRKWIAEDLSDVIEVTPEPKSKTREQVKYLTQQELSDILFFLDDSVKPGRRTESDRDRLKALILTIRWSGLRISDAVALKQSDIKGDELFKRTKKSKTAVQIPLPSVLINALAKLTPYENGYYFWDGKADIKWARHNYGNRLRDLFEAAGIKDGEVQQVSHRLRNTFAVDLLEKGIPLETVSLMLGHRSVAVTQAYYADYTTTFMDRAAQSVRDAWKRSAA
jgi:integrase/recombinase XerD